MSRIIKYNQYFSYQGLAFVVLEGSVFETEGIKCFSILNLGMMNTCHRKVNYKY